MTAPAALGGVRPARTLPRGTVPGLFALALVLAAGLAPRTGKTVAVLVALVVLLAVVNLVSRAVEGRRRATDRTVTVAVVASFLVALAPLVAVLTYTVAHGAKRFDPTFFTHSLNGIGARDAGGGAYHALIGTLEQVGIATLVSVPFGLLVSVYLVEYGRGRLAGTLRYGVDVMTGIPSVVAGLFVLAFWVLGLGRGFSGFAASLALVVLMLPTVVRTGEEMLRLVPSALREASLALGVPLWKTVLRIVLPTALPGIVTGVMLAIARVTGETAPVLLTAFGNNVIVNDPLSAPQSSLPLFVFQQAASPQATAVDRAWTAALTLVLLVMLLNLVARLVTRRSTLGR